MCANSNVVHCTTMRGQLSLTKAAKSHTFDNRTIGTAAIQPINAARPASKPRLFFPLPTEKNIYFPLYRARTTI